MRYMKKRTWYLFFITGLLLTVVSCFSITMIWSKWSFIIGVSICGLLLLMYSNWSMRDVYKPWL